MILSVAELSEGAVGEPIGHEAGLIARESCPRMMRRGSSWAAGYRRGKSQSQVVTHKMACAAGKCLPANE